MPIERKSRLKPGSIHPSLVTAGLDVDLDTGVLSAQELVDEDVALNTRIDDLYWRDPLSDTNAFENKNPEDYRIGEAFFSIQENNVYIYIGDTSLASADRSSYQPQSWIDANRTEKFLVVSAGIDADTWASRQYVDDEIANLIGGAPDVLDTLNDLVTAINNDPNFGATILAELADLEANKADKTEVYTQAEIDTLETELLAAIAASTDRFSNVVDYVCGPDQDDDDQDFGQLWLDTKNNVSTATPKNYLLKQSVQSPVAPPIEIDRGGVNLLGFHPPEKEQQYSHINNLIVRLSQSELEDPLPVLTFTNISFNRFFVQPDSNACVIVFNNCYFEQADGYTEAFENQKADCIFYFNKCQFQLDANPFRSSGSKLYITDSKFIDANSAEVFDVAATQESFVLNSHFEGSISITDTSDIRIEKTFLKTTQDAPFITLDDTSLGIFQRLTFSTPEVYSSFYFSGTGKAYFDYNIVDISLLPAPNPESRVKQPTANSTLNSDDGADIYHFLDPLGSSNFFYNDEKARDAIGAMFESSTHSSPVTFTYTDADNTLDLTLSLSTNDLSDVDSIAFKNRQNTFTQTNTFNLHTDMQSVTATTFTSGSIQATAATITSINTTTQNQADDSTLVATTAYVREAITTLSQQIFEISVDELQDATIDTPTANQVLAYVGGDDPASQWQNKTLQSINLADSVDLVREGDSVFRLSKLNPPSIANQTGNGSFTGGYSSTNQVLAWNGSLRILPNGTEGEGAYHPVLSNDTILYATEQKIGTTYDGAGKIMLAEDDEVRDGASSNKAVVPSHLRSFYLRTDASNLDEATKQTTRDNLGITDEYALHNMSNIPAEDKQAARTNLDIGAEFVRLDATNIADPDPIREALGFALPSEPNILLESNDASQFVGVKRALPYYQQVHVDFTQDADNTTIYEDNGGEKFYFVNQAGSIFINAETESNTANYIILPTLNGGYDALVNFNQFYNLPAEDRIGPVVVRKGNGSTLEQTGSLSLMCGSNDDRIITADNIVPIPTSIPNTHFNQSQIDLINLGHTVVLWPITIGSDLYWYAEGFYEFSTDQQNPTVTVNITDEVASDVITDLFDHNAHSSSLSIEYDDPNQRLVLTQHFANQAQVNAGTISDLCVAPDTLKTFVDASVLPLLRKDQNLADLQDAAVARQNLQLGTLATIDSGSLFGEVPLVASTLSSGYIAYNGTLNGLTTQQLPTASTTSLGLVGLATLTGFTDNTQSNKVVTVGDLHDALTTDNPYVDAIKTVTNTTEYTSTNTAVINAQLNRYYSISTDNGNVTINLPQITNQPQGSLIKIKYRNQVANTDTLTIVPSLNQTIDNSTNAYVLNIEGQFIILTLGTSGWEIN